MLTLRTIGAICVARQIYLQLSSGTGVINWVKSWRLVWLVEYLAFRVITTSFQIELLKYSGLIPAVHIIQRKKPRGNPTPRRCNGRSIFPIWIRFSGVWLRFSILEVEFLPFLGENMVSDFQHVFNKVAFNKSSRVLSYLENSIQKCSPRTTHNHDMYFGLVQYLMGAIKFPERDEKLYGRWFILTSSLWIWHE